jgi:hypothetical protein
MAIHLSHFASPSGGDRKWRHDTANNKISMMIKSIPRLIEVNGAVEKPLSALNGRALFCALKRKP